MEQGLPEVGRVGVNRMRRGVSIRKKGELFQHWRHIYLAVVVLPTTVLGDKMGNKAWLSLQGFRSLPVLKSQLSRQLRAL